MQRLFIQKGVVRGMGLLEVVVSVSIVAVVLVFFSNTFVQFINTGKQVTEKTQALYLAEEGLELMRFVRDYNQKDFLAALLRGVGGIRDIATTPWDSTGAKRSSVATYKTKDEPMNKSMQTTRCHYSHNIAPVAIPRSSAAG